MLCPTGATQAQQKGKKMKSNYFLFALELKNLL